MIRRFRPQLFVLFLSLTGLMTITSCKKDDDPGTPPSITVSPNNIDVTVGKNMLLNVNALSETSIQKIVATERIDGSTKTLEEKTFNSASADWDYTYTMPASIEVGKTVEITFTATDNAGVTVSATARLKAKAPAPQVWHTYETLNNYGHSEPSNFFSAADASAYINFMAKKDQALMDLVYYEEGGIAYMAAPNDTNAAKVAELGLVDWTTRNATQVRMTSLMKTDFDHISTEAAIRDAFETAPGPVKTSVQFKLNDIIAFKTVGGKYGLLRVYNIKSGLDGSITVHAKVEK